MSPLFERFSSKENLKKAYVYVQNELAHSSLSVNPINHPATTSIDNLGEQFFIALEKYIRDGKYKPERGFFVYIPKDNLGLRPVCVPSMIDRIIYQAMFNQNILGFKIDGQISDKVCFANRVNDNEKDERFLSPYFNGWDDFCKQQKKSFEKGFVWKLEVDVQQYYEHIPVGRLINKLTDDFGIKDDSILSILKEQLCTWAEYEELPKGIPQGPNSSAVIGNVYLSSLDKYAENELVGKDLKYIRYADDITLMGKSKEAVLKATEKIVHFLRGDNLTLNEKTKLTELKDADAIEAMRFISDYEDDNTQEIPADDFARIQENVPDILASIEKSEKIEKNDIRELKYFLRKDTTYNDITMMRFIEAIPLRPSLTVPIVQYVAEGIKTLDPFDASIIDFTLWKTYDKKEMSEWSRFWIFKLLVSKEDVSVQRMDKEVELILASKSNTVFKIVCFYYQAIQNKKIDIDQLKQVIELCKTDVEKSLYSFFLLNTFQDARASVVKSCIEKLLNSASPELNLIGSYLHKNKPKTIIDGFDGIFANYLLNPSKKRKLSSVEKEEANAQINYYLIKHENLIPVASPSSILGVNRRQKGKHTIELEFPEIVQWEKVVLKMKEGLQDVEIWYDKQHIRTASYIELGFSANKKEHKPDRKWNFLTILSVLQSEDIKLATPNKLMPMLAKHSGRAIGIADVHQTKRQLLIALKSVFKTSNNPFIDNRQYYEPRFRVLPEPTLRVKEIRRQGGRLNENINDDTEE